MDRLSTRIAGEITLSDDPGGTMKKWREIFKISQVELANFLGISPSTISDYEGNRRKSPGIKVIKRFVEALIEIDKMRGGKIIRSLEKGLRGLPEFFEAHEFKVGISAKEFCEIIQARPVVGEEWLPKINLYGYTWVDSLKVILELPYDDFVRIYGETNERALIFTQVSTGRSPMVAVRVAPIKPRLVVLHNLKKVDRLAQKIAHVLKIPLAVTEMEKEDIARRLEKFE